MKVLPIIGVVWIALVASVSAGELYSTTPDISVATPVSPPEWALLEWQLLDAQSAACEEFYERFFDPATGYLLCVRVS